MARTNRYGHFCPSAHALEIIGEKWSLLVVRDLLRGPQRYTDLLRSMRNVTSKALLNRLRDLEEVGIVERDRREGRREVWYSLTNKGRDLAPLLQELATWGTKHAIRPPLHDETVHPPQVIYSLIYFLNKPPLMPIEPVIWVFRFPGNQAYTVRFQGESWVSDSGEVEADVLVETTPQALAMLITAGPEESGVLLERMDINGEGDRIQQFIASFGAGVTS